MANTLNLGDGNWGVKDSSLLGYAKDNTKFVPETFDVTRASSGTRVNKDGLIETPAEIGSEEVVNGDFATNSNWNENGSTLPYMTISGGVLNSNNTNNGSWFAEYISQDISFVNAKVYLVTFKARSISGAASFRITQNANIIITNNLTTEWVDYSATYTANADNGSIRFFINNTVGQFEIDNISVVEYNDENLARIDYTDGVEGVLLTEPQSTNLVTHSSDFSDSYWENSSIDVTINNDISPDGALNGSLLSDGLNNSIHRLRTANITSGTDYVFSVYVKSGTTSRVALYDYSGGTGGIGFNLADKTNFPVNGLVVSSTYGYGETVNGYTRIWIKTVYGANNPIAIFMLDESETITYLGANNTMYFWGGQLEELSYATSYIPTYGQIASRAGDEVTNGGDASNFNSEEGVLFAEIAALANSGEFRMISISDGSAINRAEIDYNAVDNQLRYTFIVGSVNVTSSFNPISSSLDFNKIAVTWKLNEFKVYLNGVNVHTSTSGAVPAANTFDRLSFDGGSNNNPFFGKTKNIQVFNTVLTDAELITLTTI